MKRALLHILLILNALLPGATELCAQQLSQARQKYQQFLSQRLSHDQESSYQTLMESYQDYVAILDRSPHASQEFIESKRALAEMRPYLQIAAGHFSSQRKQEEALPFAQAFVDIPLMEAFSTDRFREDDTYPTMVYFAASGTYNSGDVLRTIRYLREYMRTGDQQFRQNVSTILGKTLIDTRQFEEAMEVLEQASNQYPDDFLILSMAINTCIEREDNPRLQTFLTKALKIHPEDEALLNIQGKLYEDTFDFQKALITYQHMSTLKPNSLSIQQHIALNYYNLGVLNYNRATTEQTEETALQYDATAKDYFYAAVESLQNILSNDPSSLKYALALAECYACLHDSHGLERANQRVLALGGKPVDYDLIPTLISYQAPTANSNPASMAPAHQEEDRPLYSSFAKEYVESALNQWQVKDPYETMAEYRQRVTVDSRDAKIKELLKEAEARYIARYSRGISLKDLTLMPYDAENKAFLVKSPYGDLIVPVPRENNEARVFEANWTNMRIGSPEFYISDNQLLLSSLTFLTPTGAEYTYRGDRNLNYTETKIDLNFDAISEDAIAATSENAGAGRQKVETVYASIGTSDVDENIPNTGQIRENTFAIVIANENYSMVSKVPFAINDGKVFGQYCARTLGIPAERVKVYCDATYGTMLRAISSIRDIAYAFDGNINILFYYAGHGIPNEASKDAFLLPIDSDARQTEGCYSLKRLYDDLAATRAQSIIVFLDACFSGAARDDAEHMLASARGVGVAPNMRGPSGNMVVFSAASGDQTAYPFKEKSHGLFTYFLLKKMQENEGDITLGELSDYISKQVKQQSVLMNNKLQTPSITPSPSIAAWWQSQLL